MKYISIVKAAPNRQQRMKGGATAAVDGEMGGMGLWAMRENGMFAPVHYSRAMAQELNYKNARAFRIVRFSIKMKSLKINRMKRKKIEMPSIVVVWAVYLFVYVFFCLSSQTKMAL